MTSNSVMTARPGRQRCHVVLGVEIRKWIDQQGKRLGLTRGQVVEALARKARAGDIVLDE